MLSLDNCRRYLRTDEDISDEELAIVREQLFALAGTLLDFWKNERAGTTEIRSIDSAKEFFAPDQVESIEERAAVIEFDGNYSRDEAERLAIKSAFEM
jgi:hypothetical protein